ncbi:MAG: DUF2461 domain-containing protein [Bacteroidota bacterium]
MNTAQIPASTLEFLQSLKENNNREWFRVHKDRYQKELGHMKTFIEALRHRMDEHDLIERHRLYRIYRDVRFRKDKTPYKSEWGGSFRRQKPQLRGGYFFAISPGNSVAEGGFWGPNKEDLLLIRKKLTWDHEEMNRVLSEPTFSQTFGKLQGQKVKTAPRGFSVEEPGIDLIRHKQFYVIRSFTDEEVLDTDFMDLLVDTFCALRPFFDYMTDLLTTDLNGEALI